MANKYLIISHQGDANENCREMYYRAKDQQCQMLPRVRATGESLNDTSTLEKDLEVSYKTKHTPI